MPSEINVFAQTTYRGTARKFGIKTDDRRRHMYVVGKTGMGKSTILENMIINDIRAGNGVAVVDPHGDLAEKIIEYIPADRINDVVYFNPSDNEYPIAFNVIEQVEPHLRHLVASGLIGVFQKLWADSWGPRLEYILRNAILAILDYPGSTLLAVVRMLSDKPFRKKVIEKIQDPVVKAFWVNEFAGYADKFASEAVSPIQNKVGQFLSSSLMRNIVGQVKSSINIREVMDGNKILILNLSKGRIGEDNSALLGAMMITKIQLAAMSRVDIPEKDRKDFYLYIDEFQNFMTDSFANILSEARKYHLNLIMAHQYIEQLSERVKPAVFGNVGTMVVYRVGAADAEELVKEFQPTFTEEDLVNLPKYEFYLKLMIDGVSSNPFSARCMPPLPVSEKTGNVEKVIMVSRERFAKKRELVEDRIMRWTLGQDDDDDEMGAEGKPTPEQPAPIQPASSQPVQGQPAEQRPSASASPSAERGVPNTPRIISPKQETRFERSDNAQAKPKPAKKPAKPTFEVACSRCGKTTATTFQPDGVRPVYCKECLDIIRNDRKSEQDNRKALKEQELERLAKGTAKPAAPKPQTVPVQPVNTKAVANEGGVIRTAGGGTITFVKREEPRPEVEKTVESPIINVEQNAKRDDGEEFVAGQTIKLN